MCKKKLFYSLIFLLSFSYFLYDCSQNFISLMVDYSVGKSELADTIYLHSTEDVTPFHRKNKNRFCSVNRCGTIKNFTKNGFDIYWEEYQYLHFIASKNEKDMYILKTEEEKNINNKQSEITFKYKNYNGIENVHCSSNGGCTINNKKAPFDFVISAKHFKKETPFETKYTLNQSETIILNNREGKIFALSKKDDFFEEIKFKDKKNNFLFIITSYKRPVYLSGLIYQLKNQSYPTENFDISISLKGIDKDVKKYLLDPDFEELLSTKQIFIREDINKNQFSNMLDTFRDIDLSKYDYICKISDGDWYHKDYLNNINHIVNALNKPHFITSGQYTSLLKSNTEVYLTTNYTSKTDSNTCFSINYAKQLIEIEKNSDDILKTKSLKNANLNKSIKNSYNDLILNAFSQEKNSKYMFFSLNPLFICNQEIQSIMRPN